MKDFLRKRVVLTILGLIVSVILILSIYSNQNQPISTTTPMREEFQIQVIKTGSGFGYDIFRNGRKVIHQPHLPGVSGNVAFSTDDQALQTAKLAISKMKKGIMPPTISAEELDSILLIK